MFEKRCLLTNCQCVTVPVLLNKLPRIRAKHRLLDKALSANGGVSLNVIFPITLPSACAVMPCFSGQLPAAIFPCQAGGSSKCLGNLLLFRFLMAAAWSFSSCVNVVDYFRLSLSPLKLLSCSCCNKSLVICY